jgi:hypothetical protein
MRRILSIGLIGAALVMGAASVAQAQDLTPAVQSGPASIDWPISALLADPVLNAVIAKDLPTLQSSQYLEMIKPTSLRTLSKIPQANIDQATLDKVQADLTAAAATESSAPAAAPAPAPAPAAQ